ncbi:hypothetical protein [Evansella halocellulosilytica]|uniref:hypothetical protein n=1 Tax=Evansella halocellulosilytica TaxID=2011013 RepID=UPI0015CE22B2|nr:hypothetical protein [Evansella halocellulosilytica]
MEPNTINLIIVLSLLLIGLIINVVTSLWAYRDAQSKGHSKEFALIVLFGTLFLPFVGALIYLYIRNK